MYGFTVCWCNGDGQEVACFLGVAAAAAACCLSSPCLPQLVSVAAAVNLPACLICDSAAAAVHVGVSPSFCTGTGSARALSKLI